MKVKIVTVGWDEMLVNQDGLYAKPFNVKPALSIKDGRMVYIVSSKWVDSGHGGGGEFTSLKVFDAVTDVEIKSSYFEDEFNLEVYT